MVYKIILILVSVTLAYGCLITNCPRGGKRSNVDSLIKNPIKQCPSCGSDKQGQCFGPRICCGPTMGCLIGSPETKKCRRESLFSRPCVAGYAMCRGNSGRCAATGICCTQVSCYIDPGCGIAEEGTPNGQSINSELNSLLSEGNLVISEQNEW